MFISLSNQRLLLSLCIASALAGCGTSDLEDLHKSEIAAAREAAIAAAAAEGDASAGQTTAAPDLGAAGGDTTDGDTGGSGNEPEVVTDTDTDTDGTDAGATDGNDVADQNAAPVDNESDSPGFDLTGYEVIFNDEFNGTTLNNARWNTAFEWGPDLVIFDQQQYYVDTQNDPDFGYDPFQFDGQNLVLTAMETPSDLLTAANDQPYLSGALTTAGKFSYQYGYMEMRAELPKGAGLWSSLWMLARDYVDLKPELFVMEYDGGQSSNLFHNYIYQDANGSPVYTGQIKIQDETLSSGFHTFGVAWQADEFTFYVDGTPRYRVAGPDVAKQPMYLLTNLAVGGNWVGSPAATTTFPAEMKIDYIRVYQQPAQ